MKTSKLLLLPSTYLGPDDKVKSWSKDKTKTCLQYGRGFLNQSNELFIQHFQLERFIPFWQTPGSTDGLINSGLSLCPSVIRFLKIGSLLCSDFLREVKIQ